MAELRAMVLAAGLGLRLRPLTAVLPKPLVPVLGVPLLAAALDAAERAGATRIAVNLHHLPDAVRAAFPDRERNAAPPIDWFHEPELLGTGGGLRNARASFAGADAVLLLNGDTLLEADLATLVSMHLSAGAAATLLVRENPDPIRFPPVVTDHNMRVVRIAGQPAGGDDPAHRSWLFAGVHVLDPRVLELLPAGVSDINRALHPRLIAAGERVQAVRHDGLWSDVGTPSRLIAATRAALARPPERLLSLARTGGYTLEQGVLWGRGVVGREQALVLGSVIGHQARLQPGARIEDSVVFPGCSIASGDARETILGPGAEVRSGEQLLRVIRAGQVSRQWQPDGEAEPGAAPASS